MTYVNVPIIRTSTCRTLNSLYTYSDTIIYTDRSLSYDYRTACFWLDLSGLTLTGLAGARMWMCRSNAGNQADATLIHDVLTCPSTTSSGPPLSIALSAPFYAPGTTSPAPPYVYGQNTWRDLPLSTAQALLSGTATGIAVRGDTSYTYLLTDANPDRRPVFQLIYQDPAPAMPLLTAPDFAVCGGSAHLSWQDGGGTPAASWEVRADGAVAAAAGTSYDLPVTWAAGAGAVVAVRGLSAGGAAGPWSAEKSVVASRPPAPPAALFPRMGGRASRGGVIAITLPGWAEGTGAAAHPGGAGLCSLSLEVYADGAWVSSAAMPASFTHDTRQAGQGIAYLGAERAPGAAWVRLRSRDSRGFASAETNLAFSVEPAAAPALSGRPLAAADARALQEAVAGAAGGSYPPVLAGQPVRASAFLLLQQALDTFFTSVNAQAGTAFAVGGWPDARAGGPIRTETPLALWQRLAAA